MRKRKQTPALKTAKYQQLFQSRKYQKQWITTATVGLLLFSGYILPPIQVLAAEESGSSQMEAATAKETLQFPTASSVNTVPSIYVSESNTTSVGETPTEETAQSSEVDEPEKRVSDKNELAGGEWTNTQHQKVEWSIRDEQGRTVLVFSEGILDVSSADSAAGLPWSGYSGSIQQVRFHNVTAGSSLYQLFANMNQLKDVSFDGLNTTNVQDISGLFQGCSSLETLNFSSFKGPVTGINLFAGAASLKQLTISEGFKLTKEMRLRELEDESDHWVKDQNHETTATSTEELIANHNKLTEGTAHTYTVGQSQSAKFQTFAEVYSNLYEGTFDEGGKWYIDQEYGLHVSGGKLETPNLTAPWDAHKSTIKTVEFDPDKPTTGGENLFGLFKNHRAVTTINLTGFDTSQVKNMNQLFASCSKLQKLDMSTVNTSQVTTMDSMFYFCSVLQELNLSNVDTSQVTNMMWMFFSCPKLQELDLNHFDTSKVKNMSGMFSGCTNLEAVNVSNFDTNNVTNMEEMFRLCSKLKELDLSSFYTDSSTKMKDMFQSSPNLQTIKLANTFDFIGTTQLRELPKKSGDGKTTYHWTNQDDLRTAYDSTAAFTAGQNAYTGSSPITYTIKAKHEVSFDLNGGTGSIANQRVFEGESASKPTVNPTKDNYRFVGWYDNGQPYSFNSLVDTSLTLTANWESVKASGTFAEEGFWWIDNEDYLHVSGGKLKTTTSTRAPWDAHRSTIKTVVFDPQKPTIGASDLYGLFMNHSAVKTIDFTGLDTSQVTDMKAMFYKCGNLTTLDLSILDTSQVTTMFGMFLDCSSLTNVNLENVDTSKVKDMENMFSGCSSLSSLELSSLDTSQVTKMAGMFKSCGSLTELNLSGFDTGQVTDMAHMISQCKKLQKVDVSSFDTNKVANMYAMFYGCSKLKELDLTSFSIGQNTNMGHMFFTSNVLQQLTITNQFDFKGETGLRALPTNVNKGKTTCHWVKKDDLTIVYDTTADFIEGHKGYTGNMPITYTIKEKHEVSFDLKGGIGTIVNQWIFEGEQAIKPTVVPKKDNYRFVGWHLNGKAYDFTSLISSPVELHVQWDAVEYTVNFLDPEGGTITKEQYYTVEKGLASLPTPTRKGYSFAGWYDGENKVESIPDGSKGDRNLTARWNVETYKVTFDSAGGEAVNSQDYTVEKGLASLPTPMRKGYSFAGWYDGANRVESIPDGSTGDRNLTARWSLETYTVIFDSAGGEAVNPQDYTVEKGLVSLPTPTRKGYSFAGWYDGANKVESIPDGSTGDRNLTAHWNIETYTVMFDSSGGEAVHSQDYTVEKGLVSLPTPTRKGYSFVGWYDGENKVESIPDGSTGDRTLTAHWQANSYMVQFDANGGEGKMAEQSMTYDQAAKLSPVSFTRTGYEFIGWNTDKTGKGTAYINGLDVINLTDTGTITLYAQWRAASYTVTFDSGSGSIIEPLNYTIEKGLAKLPTPTRKGYSFTGWYDGENKIESIPDGSIGDRTLKANWKLETYTITFETEGDPILSIDYTVETPGFELPKVTRKQRGYTFIGWLVKGKPTRAVVDIGEIVTRIEAGTIGNLVLTESWKPNDYKINFHANGGVGKMSAQEMVYSQKAQLITNKFTRAGYSFKGWNTQVDGKGTTYTNQQEISNLVSEEKGSITLYAQWQPTRTALEEGLKKEKDKNRNKDDYTEDSWKVYEEAIKEAERVLADPNADPATVQRTLENLEKAISNLTLNKKSAPISAQYLNKPISSVGKKYLLTGMVSGSGLVVVGIATVGAALAGWRKKKK
ncbi:InlB B-repeat-containing protein [Candidatus Enterococcus ferrettii]|uniref:BspA family leucine-rich repeat surface protein n=1 Tax=Candidatus Enterococcus ferrettii TaxID=2815324 RepID=A0ABV0ETS5_9ENTE|nr:InlB B-repeat-containing protein [Enterococcus sp. 665A]MBO1342267.1 InlB B-repeat-containing protein [Enterococcus sp. 665A]